MDKGGCDVSPPLSKQETYHLAYNHDKSIVSIQTKIYKEFQYNTLHGEPPWTVKGAWSVLTR